MGHLNPYSPPNTNTEIILGQNKDLPQKTIRKIASITAFIYCLPIIYYYSQFKIKNWAPSDSFQYDAGSLSGIFGCALGLAVGVWASAYSSLLLRPKSIVYCLLSSLIHAAFWSLLFVGFTNLFLLWKFKKALHLQFPILPHVERLAWFYIECYSYSLAILLTIRLVIWMFERRTTR
jgi:hypothetical protein